MRLGRAPEPGWHPWWWYLRRGGAVGYTTSIALQPCCNLAVQDWIYAQTRKQQPAALPLAHLWSLLPVAQNTKCRHDGPTGRTMSLKTLNNFIRGSGQHLSVGQTKAIEDQRGPRDPMDAYGFGGQILQPLARTSTLLESTVRNQAGKRLTHCFCGETHSTQV